MTRQTGWYWTPNRVVAAMQVFEEIYGRRPTYTDFNPTRDQTEAYERNRSDGCWPSGATVNRHWGSWNNAIKAAGYEPAVPGTYKRVLFDKCIHGHDYTPENTDIIIRRGREVRVCITCRRRMRNESYDRLYGGKGADARIASGETKEPRRTGGRPKVKETA